MAKKKVKLSKNESENIMPIIREFNKIAGAVSSLLGQRVESKERKISVMVSQIKRPDQKSGQIKVKTVEFTKGFLKKQRNKKKKDADQSEWDEMTDEEKATIAEYIIVVADTMTQTKR